MKQFQAKIVVNKKIGKHHGLLTFELPGKTIVKPGQFFNIRINDSYTPLLRRPFGAHKIEKNKVSILYKIVGEATAALSAKLKGNTVNVIGPLGNGFNISEKEAILIAGGYGIAPLYALALSLRGGAKRRRGNLSIFIGANTKKQVIYDDKFRKLGVKVRIATDDGSKGQKGLVTDILENRLRTGAVRKAVIYACGPKAMLKAVAKIAKQYKIKCQLSLEEYMACGIGTCLGCAVKTKDGYKMVCKDGPVFDAKDIVWQI